MKGDLPFDRRGKEVMLTPAEAERNLSTDEKLGELLPRLLSIPSPMGTREWELYVGLRRRRDATIHFKSHHQLSLADRDFSDSPYAWFLNNDVLTIPAPAIDIFRHFAAPEERDWVDGAEEILRSPIELTERGPEQSSEPPSI